jgi:hypothetical protein
VEEQATARIISTLVGLATRCGLGQTALRSKRTRKKLSKTVRIFCAVRGFLLLKKSITNAGAAKNLNSNR